MSDGLTAMHDDAEHYVWLCKHFKERPRYWRTPGGGEFPDAHSAHAQKLEKRWLASKKKKR